MTDHAKAVVRIVDAVATYEGEGFLVHRPFPTAAIPMIDPFLLLDEMGPIDLAPGEAKGAPDHPHRGFETVTYLLEGEFEHRDSVGNHGILRPGDVQWMTAGAGVVHSEMPSRGLQELGGRLHGFQLWVNLPRADKMRAPRYQELHSNEIPIVEREGATVRVIAGDVFDVHGPAQTFVPITYVHARLAPQASLDIPVPRAANSFVYLVGGDARVGGDLRDVSSSQAAIFDGDGDRVHVDAGVDGAELLLLAGEPLREPVARYGPFVMNTKQEILDAIDDFQAGRMGAIT